LQQSQGGDVATHIGQILQHLARKARAHGRIGEGEFGACRGGHFDGGRRGTDLQDSVNSKRVANRDREGINLESGEAVFDDGQGVCTGFDVDEDIASGAVRFGYRSFFGAGVEKADFSAGYGCLLLVGHDTRHGTG
jgi:hypothetical protein